MVALHMATQWRTPSNRRLLLEFLDVRAVVGQPVAVQHVVDAPEEASAITDLRPADMKFFGEGGGASEDR